MHHQLQSGRADRKTAPDSSRTASPMPWVANRGFGTPASPIDCRTRLPPAVQAFWNSPAIASKQGPKAVEMFDRIHSGQIKAVWIMATNPVVSLPDADKVKEALRRCEFVVVSDVMGNTDTAALAHVLLPALAWGEKDGMVTNSDRTMSRQRPFLPAPGEARADWRIVCDVAKSMGHAGFDFQSAHEIFREHAQLSAHANDGQRAFNIGAWSGSPPR